LCRGSLLCGIFALLFFLLPAPVSAEVGLMAFEDPSYHCPVIAVRPFITELGGEVVWDQENQAVDIYVYGAPPLCLCLRTGTLNGIRLEPRPFARNGATFAPFLELSECLGLGVTSQNGKFVVLSPEGITVLIGYTRLQGSYTIAFNDREAQTPNFANACRAGYYLNGYLVKAGDIFSFNKSVGPRNRERGFIPGITFIGQRQVYEMGGGVCRAATLLHNAVLDAGLEIIERHCHSQPVTYVPPGRDATIYYGVLDYRFRNNQQEAIELEFLQEGPKITMRIWRQG
jgi:hypothetical protein